MLNVGRQLIVDPAPQRICAEGRADVEMRHLCERVHARVGAPGAVELEVLPSGHVRTAASISPCTVRAFFWICQPLYFVPAYSMVSLYLGNDAVSPARDVLCASAG